MGNRSYNNIRFIILTFLTVCLVAEEGGFGGPRARLHKSEADELHDLKEGKTK